MKLGYRDRIILLIVCIVVIFAVGIFVFIKPKWEKLNQNQKTYDKDKAAWDTKLKEFARIDLYQSSIEKKYKEADDIAANFTDEMTSIELDDFLRSQFLNIDQYKNDEVELRESYSVSDEQTATLNYYYYSPSIVTYPLYEAADLDGSLEKAAKEKRKDADILSARSSQAVGSGASEFTLLINRADTMALLDAIQKYAADKKDAMMIRSIELKEADFNENIEEDEEGGMHEETYVDDDGNEQTRMVPNEPKEKDNAVAAANIKKDYTEVTVKYEVYYIQEPTQPDVGPKYDANIWNGNEWRTALAQ
ncbi:MAG: hypothetical protein IKQ39_08220 [Oscillospiraceae bacterium]|nr:hypothetical protein [Oscillospiraceae bacterium]